eukprot:Pgem_evm1s7331
MCYYTTEQGIKKRKKRSKSTKNPVEHGRQMRGLFLLKDRPCQCEFEGCGRSYSSPHSRRQHYRRHHLGQFLPGRKMACGMQKKSGEEDVEDTTDYKTLDLEKQFVTDSGLITSLSSIKNRLKQRVGSNDAAVFSDLCKENKKSNPQYMDSYNKQNLVANPNTYSETHMSTSLGMYTNNLLNLTEQQPQPPQPQPQPQSPQPPQPQQPQQEQQQQQQPKEYDNINQSVNAVDLEYEGSNLLWNLQQQRQQQLQKIIEEENRLRSQAFMHSNVNSQTNKSPSQDERRSYAYYNEIRNSNSYTNLNSDIDHDTDEYHHSSIHRSKSARGSNVNPGFTTIYRSKSSGSIDCCSSNALAKLYETNSSPLLLNIQQEQEQQQLQYEQLKEQRRIQQQIQYEKEQQHHQQQQQHQQLYIDRTASAPSLTATAINGFHCLDRVKSAPNLVEINNEQQQQQYEREYQYQRAQQDQQQYSRTAIDEVNNSPRSYVPQTTTPR